jgi:catechol 2,3-dioxygenase
LNKSFDLSPNTAVGHVRLNVHNVKRSLHFYSELLGFQTIGKASNDNAVLAPVRSDNNYHLLELGRVNTTRRVNNGEQSIMRQAGLYHFAILLPSRKHLANIFKHLTENSSQIYFEGAADHGVSESLYIRDPEHNGIEIYRDKEQSEWKRIGKFQVEMKTDHLNLEQLLSEAEDEKDWHMPSKTVIGHVHLHVSNLVNSKKFYSEILGLHHTCSYPGANFFAADSYHHHIATNTWLGTDIASADSNNSGLDYFSLDLKSKETFDDLLHQLRRLKVKVMSDDSNKINNKSFFILDPDKIKIKIHY